MQSAIPGDWECVAKAYQNREPSASNTGLSRWANAAYVGDLSYDYDGLKEAVGRVQARAAYIPAPFAELTGYAYLDHGIPDEDVYYRRLHFGALQPVMAHTPYANSDPWRREYGADLVKTYRYWAWLHKELVPFFYSYAYRMYENPARRLLWRSPMPYALRVGAELYAPIVTEPTETMDIRLPNGQWIDYWDESRVLSGVLAAFPVPLGREPVFIRLGSILPMNVRNAQTGHGTAQSSGALTVLVYPSGTSSFRYRQDARTPWVTFTSALTDDQLILTAEPGLPGQPVLYRVGRWDAAPESVGVDGATVTVNQGGSVPRLSTEAAVNGSRASGWFYDSAARRLVVKVVP
jgi:alpha-glucosidase (family GH31 glycosyl hydrolase)